MPLHPVLQAWQALPAQVNRCKPHPEQELQANHLAFPFRTPDFPMLVLAPQFVEELRSASDDKYSAVLANSEFMQFRHTLHPVIEYDQYQNVVVQKQLTQCLGKLLTCVA